MTDAVRVGGLSAAKQALLRSRLGGRSAGNGHAIPRRPAGESPLSPVQHGMWITDQFLERKGLYNVPRVLRLTGSVQVGTLRRALDTLAGRHEILRTIYPEPAALQQEVLPPGTVAFEYADLGSLPGDARWDEAVRRVHIEIERPFDLASGPVFRALLIRLHAGDHVFVLTLHHIAADGWSCALLLRELDHLYGAMAAGRPVDLPPPRIQYADYAAWQQARLAGGLQDRQLAYWKSALADVPRVLELPTDRSRPTVPSYEGDSVRVTLAPSRSGELRELATRQGVTVYTLLLTCFSLVLRHYCGQSRFAVGSLVSGRNDADTESLVGLFANAVALPMDLSGEATFAELLRRSHASVLDAFDHQDVTFEQVVSAVQRDRVASRNPVYQVLYQCFEEDERVTELPGLRAGAVPMTELTAKVDLTLDAVNGRAIELTLNYSTDLFEERTARRLLEGVVKVAEYVVDHPDEAVTARVVLGDADERLVTTAWARNTTEYPEAERYPLDETVVDLFRARAAAAPDAVAVICGDRSLTYAELDDLTDRVAAALHAEGVRGGNVIGISLPRSADLVACVLGVLKAGAAYLALDPGYPAARLEYLTADAGARVIVGAQDGQAPGTREDVRRLRFAELTGGEASPRPAPPRSGDLAYVMYTSGSTGSPKGIDITHRGLTNFLLGARDQLRASPGDRWLLLTSLNFDPSTVELFMPLLVGAVIIVAPESARADGAERCRLIRASGVTHVQATPSGWELMLAGGLDGPLEVAVSVGETMPLPMVRQLLGRARRLVNAYGPTEITVFATYADLTADGPATRIGRPAANTEVLLLDDRMDPVPVGALGEVCIGGVGVARGYHARPGLTARRFVPHPFGPPGSRLYRSGDRARFGRDGDLDLQGRIDNQVKIRGHRVEPGELEARLLAHPAVNRASVSSFTTPDGALRLAAYVVPARDAAVDPAELERALRRYLSDTVPGYLVPSKLAVIDRMPLTPSGKIDRRALPGVEDLAGAADVPAPRTEAELALARVWSGVLAQDSVAVTDNFFDIGGDSVLAIFVVNGVAQAGWLITPRQVLSEPTLASLAAVAEPMAGTQADAMAAPPDAPSHVDTYPLAPLQTGMVFHTLFEPTSADYLVQHVFAVNGDLDPALLRAAWAHVIGRHPGLRTTFVWEDRPEPMQVVHRDVTVSMRELDWSDSAPADVPDRLAAHVAAERRVGVDLVGAPPLRFDLIRLADGTFRFVWHYHHALADGWSVGFVLDEVLTTYRCLQAAGVLPALAEPAPFRAYVDWLGRQDSQDAADYWKATLSDVTGPTPLAIVPPEPGHGRRTGSHDVAFLRDDLSAEVTDRLRRLASRNHLTVAAVVHAAWALLLSRYGGGPDVVFGSTTAGRSAPVPGIRQIVGLLINTLPVRIRVPASGSVLDWLHEVHDALLRMRDFEHCALIDVQRHSQVPAGQALFDTILMFDGMPSTSRQGSPVFVPVQTWEQTGYPVVLNVGLTEQLRVRLDYAPDRIPEDTARRFLAHFRMLVESIAGEPEARIAELPALPAAEWDSVVRRFNDTAATYPAELCLHELFEAQAGRTPDAVALLSEDGSVSYRGLDERANRLARRLAGSGVGTESLVGICVERSVDMVVAVLAVLKTGAAYVPLDPDYPPERLTFMLADTSAPVVVTQQRMLERFGTYQGLLVCLDDAREAARIAACGPDRLPGGAAPENLSYVIYTSGSTGRPKGTLIRHQGIVNYIDWMARTFRLEEGEKVLQLAGLSFDISVYEMFWPLSRGATVVLARSDGYRDPQYILDVLLRHDVTAAHLVPSMLRALLSFAERPLSLRWLFASAEALTVDVVSECARRSPGTSLVNLYGATEVSVDSTVWHADADAGTVSVGRPIANTQLYVLDGGGRPAPIDVPGEALIAGDSVGRGYHSRPGLTARRFVPDPYGPPGSRRYRTGDLVRWSADGTLEFLGRLDHQLKVRGFRVEPGEVEAALETHRQVTQAVVVAAEDPAGPTRLVAHVQRVAGSTPTVSDLRLHLLSRLPDYMVPAAFVVVDALPLNPNGKVDRRALPAPDGARPSLEEPYVAPRTGTEQVLAEAWSEVLGVARVGAHDDFFSLGGDSILSIRVMVVARRAGLTLTPKQMFANPTVAELARALQAPASSAVVRADQGTVTGDLPLTPIQRWFTELEGPRDHYNQSTRLRWTEPVDAAALARALDALLAHHDALRLRLRRTADGQWHQHVAPPKAADVLETADVGALRADEAAAAVERAADTVHTGLSLTRGPLLRALLVRYGPGRPDELVLSIHHLAVDSVSWGILLEDLATAYGRIHRGEPVALPAKTTSFREWAALLAAHADSEEFAAEAVYWRSPRPPVPPLPADRADGPDVEGSARTVAGRLDPLWTEKLLRSAHGAYRTRINDLLIAALAQTIAGHTGTRDVRVDLEGHGREPLFDDVDLSRTIGWFTSIQPLHLRVDADDPGAAVLTVREHLHEVPHHGIGHGLSWYRGSAPAPPPASVVFNYHGQTAGTGATGAFERLGSVPGRDRAPTGVRPYPLEVDAIVVDGTFRVSWTYSANRYRPATVSALAEDYLARLTRVLDHCEGIAAGRPAAPPLRRFLSRLSPAAPRTLLSMTRHQVPGVGVALLADGEVVGEWGEGVASAAAGTPVRPDTIFQAGSLSKHVTSVAVLRLVGDGVLDLDEDVERYLRGWQLPLLDRRRPVTLRALLSHTAGLTRDEFDGAGAVRPDRPVPGVLDVLTGSAPAETGPVRQELPAGPFRYSGTNFVVIEQVLADVTGRAFPDLVRELVFEPLAMTHSGYGPAFARDRGERAAVGHRPDGRPVDGGWRVYPAGTGGLWTTAGDLGRLAVDIQRAHAGMGSVVLDRAATAQLLGPLPGTAYGLGTVSRASDGVRWFGHSGETVGFQSHSVLGLESGAGLVLMTNGQRGNELILDLLVHVDLGLRVWIDLTGEGVPAGR